MAKNKNSYNDAAIPNESYMNKIVGQIDCLRPALFVHHKLPTTFYETEAIGGSVHRFSGKPHGE